MKASIDNLNVTSELIAEVKMWKELQVPENYGISLLAIQDLLSKQIGEEFDPEKCKELAEHISNLSGIRRTLKDFDNALNTCDDGRE